VGCARPITFIRDIPNITVCRSQAESAADMAGKSIILSGFRLGFNWYATWPIA
jgi:hypothetical protein